MQGNRPFPRYPLPLFQNESTCETIHMKMCSTFTSIHFYANQSHFHLNRFARRLLFKLRQNETRKWPISNQYVSSLGQKRHNFVYTYSCSLQISPTNLRRSAKILGDLKPCPAQWALRIKGVSGITMATERNKALTSDGSSKFCPLVPMVRKTEKLGLTVICQTKIAVKT